MNKRLIVRWFASTTGLLLCTMMWVPRAAWAKKVPDETQAMNAEAAEREASKSDSTPEKWGGKKLDHAKQGFVSIMPGTGYFLVAPYDKDNLSKRCAESEDNPMEGEPVCSGRSGWHLDMLAGYGLKPGLELFVIFRLGLERPDSKGLLNQPKVRQLGVGVKIYSPSDGMFKIGFGVAPMVDFSNRGSLAGIRNDLIIHVPIQAQFDVFPWFGPYVQISPNISFISEFRLEFTGGIGVQGRFP
jgi:hypothetical protein